MKAINKSAARAMRKMMSMMDNGYAKIQKSSSFMAVTIELVGQNELGKLFSVAHYAEQNGDLMRDPEVVFILGNDKSSTRLQFSRTLSANTRMCLNTMKQAKSKAGIPDFKLI